MPVALNDYKLVDVFRSFGNCSDQAYYGTDPDLACNNGYRLFPPNTNIPVYRLKVQAKAGDILRIEGQVTTTNDGNAGYLVEQQAIACANAQGIALPYDPITGNLDGTWANQINAVCPDSVKPTWMKTTPVVMVDGTRLSSEASTQVMQVVVSGALLGGRTFQEHGLDWTTTFRDCNAFPGQNCRGHMTGVAVGIYTVPSDGLYTIEVQVSELTGANLKRFDADAGGGQLSVEQFRKRTTADTDGYGLAEVQTTSSQLISTYTQASCPGHDDQGIMNNPDPHTVFKLSSQVQPGDIVRVFAAANGTTYVPTGTDATALGIYRDPSIYAPAARMDFVANAWGLYGTSIYYPWAIMYTEALDRIKTTANPLYRATLHSSNAPINCDTVTGIAPPDAQSNTYGGRVPASTGSMSLIRYSPISSGNSNLMFLQSAKEYKTAQAIWPAYHAVVYGETVFQDSFTLAKAGAVRIWSQLVLCNVNGGDAGAMTTCGARVSIPDAGIYGGTNNNSSYGATDDLYLNANLISAVPAGTHTFKFEIFCSTDNNSSKTFSIVPDTGYASLEVFSN